VRPHHPGIIGTALAALALSGCGEDPGIEQGTVPFKKSPTEPYTSQINEMKKVAREQAYVKKSEEGGRPAADSRPADDSKPAPDSRPAADTQTATKGG
jgi:hypothetical protein